MIDVEGRLGASVDSDTRPSNWSCTHAGIHHSEQREGLLQKLAPTAGGDGVWACSDLSHDASKAEGQRGSNFVQEKS